MEAVVKPMTWKEVPNPNKIVFKLFRTSGIGWFMLSAMNMFFNVIMPQMIVRKLSAEEKDYYMAPFKTRLFGVFRASP